MQTWRISAAWSSKRLNCTLDGILRNCGAGCCSLKQYWPPRVFENSRCGYLGDKGCTLTPADRPIDCLLYPLAFNNTGDTIVLHNRACLPNWVCKGNYRNGPPLIVALRECLVALFGESQYNAAYRSVMQGKDAILVPSNETVLHRKVEELMAQLNLPPIPRSQITPETLAGLEERRRLVGGDSRRWWSVAVAK
jgi:hypothetical protein